MVALAMMALGVVLIGFAIISMLNRSILLANVPVWAVAGAILLIIGLLLLITELLENWLTKGQAALVDGLQAG